MVVTKVSLSVIHIHTVQFLPYAAQQNPVVNGCLQYMYKLQQNCRVVVSDSRPNYMDLSIHVHNCL